VVAARDGFAARLAELGILSWPSLANFVLANPGGDDRQWYEGLLRRGFLVRPGSEFGLEGHLRITVGPDELMASVASAIAEVAAELGS
jgi:histidinol-phosphate aminotransferase